MRPHREFDHYRLGVVSGDSGAGGGDGAAGCRHFTARGERGAGGVDVVGLYSCRQERYEEKEKEACHP